MAAAHPFVLLQLSDPHLGADWADGHSERSLARVVEAARAAAPRADALLLSGDLADHATAAEYERVRELVAPLRAPLYVVRGNHDDAEALHRHFDVPGRNGEPVQYAADLGPLRLVVVDTVRPGEDPGELPAERLDWLDAELASAPDAPTLVALHHPPFATGRAAWDRIGLPAADRRALAALIARHPQVCGLVSGHLHRTMTGAAAGRPALVLGSTYAQAELALEGDEVELCDDPPVFAVHVLADGELVSHVQTVGRAP